MLPMSQRIYRPESVRELDRTAIDDMGIPGYELMQRAGQAAYAIAVANYPNAQRWLIVCGGGNNAGDGYVIARLARQNDIAVELVALIEPDKLQGDAALAYADYLHAGGTHAMWSAGINQSWLNSDQPYFDLIVDAILGTGLTREVTGAFGDAISFINESSAPVLAVDSPSGMNAANGEVMGAAVSAALTVTFVGIKQGFFLSEGPDLIGELHFDDLDIPAAKLAAVLPSLQAFGAAQAAEKLPRRQRATNKGSYGHVLVVGGNAGMGGAVRLCAEGALRSGAGLVSVATRPENCIALTAARPELMCHAVEESSALDALVERATVVAIGPGLGTDEWAQELLQRILLTDLPLVMDADALNLLAQQPARRENWVLTPHPGEAARLLGVDSAAVQADRLAALDELQRRYGGVVILKGHATLISGSECPWLIRAGNPGMATAGMGDVLTGITAALLAQHALESGSADELEQIAATAAWVHATTADLFAVHGERGLIASDLLAGLRATLNP